MCLSIFRFFEGIKSALVSARILSSLATPPDQVNSSVNTKLRKIQASAGAQILEVSWLLHVQVWRAWGTGKAAIHIPAQIPRQPHMCRVG